MSNQQDFIENLRITVWSTASARFNAARRLKRRDTFATLSVAFFSCVGIGLAVLQKTYAFKADSSGDRYLTLLSVCIGLFVLVISLIEWAAGNAVRADALHRNAENLNALQRKMQQKIACSKEIAPFTEVAIDGLRLEYEALKAECNYNHESIDYRLFLVEQRFSPEFLSLANQPKIKLYECCQIRIWSWIFTLGFYPAAWLIILILIYLVPFS